MHRSAMAAAVGYVIATGTRGTPRHRRPPAARRRDSKQGPDRRALSSGDRPTERNERDA